MFEKYLINLMSFFALMNRDRALKFKYWYHYGVKEFIGKESSDKETSDKEILSEDRSNC